jgi:hypothetical protein
MAYETVPLQQLLREIASRTASEQDADAIRLAADALDASITPLCSRSEAAMAFTHEQIADSVIPAGLVEAEVRRSITPHD